METFNDLCDLMEEMHDKMDAEIGNAERSVLLLPGSCIDWAKANDASIRLSRTGRMMFERMIYVPGIFDEPRIISNTGLAKLNLCDQATVPSALKQLQEFGLVQIEGTGRRRSILLTAPSKEMLNFHEGCLRKSETFDGTNAPQMSFKVALPKWSNFTARFAK